MAVITVVAVAVAGFLVEVQVVLILDMQMEMMVLLVLVVLVAGRLVLAVVAEDITVVVALLVDIIVMPEAEVAHPGAAR